MWSQAEIDALTLAFTAQRPLLIRGEAGSGKSQLARAAAVVLGHAEPIVETVHPRFEALDLLYRVDTIHRLADAQDKNLDRTNARYVRKGALWLAFEASGGGTCHPRVLLIDEIDKADADVPNALLDVLGNRSFSVPLLKNRIVRPAAGVPPLIIITTNEERELPAAFVRRCVVLNLNPPRDKDDFIGWLLQRGSVHRRLAVVEVARRHAAEQVWSDRKQSEAAGYPGVGLAEYIDLLIAVSELTADLADDVRERAQLDWLDRLSAYGLIKHLPQDQSRAPISRPGE